MTRLTKGAAALVAAFAAAFAPQPEQTIAQWAEGRIDLPAETQTALPGKLSFDGFEYCIEPLNRLHFDDTCSRIALMAAAQCGKSNIGIVWVGWIIDQRPRPIGLGMQSLEKAREFNTTKLQPVFDATDCLKVKVAPVSTRDERGSKALFKAFPGGGMTIFPATSPKSLQTSSFGAIWMTETPEYPADVGGRGSPIAQIRARMDGWEASGTKELHESTPGVLGRCPITEDFNAGDQRHFYMDCPHCDCAHRWEWEDFMVPASLAEAPWIKAPCCGGRIEEHHREAMKKTGRYLATFVSLREDNPAPGRFVRRTEIERWRARDCEGRHGSYYFWQAHSKLKTWPGIARDFRESEKSAETRATFRQQKLGLASDPAAAVPEYQAIVKAARMRGVTRGEIPRWACWLAGSADIQGDRIEWATYAFGPDAWARIDRGIIEHDPLTVEAWTALAGVVGRTYTGPHLEEIGYDAFVVDSGGKDGVSPQVYQFTRARGTRAGAGNVRSVKGASRELPGLQAVMERPVKVRLPSGRKVRHHILFVDTYAAKRQVYGALSAFVGGADAEPYVRPKGALLLEADATEEDARQITAERLILPKSYRQGERGHWDKVHPSNEQLDMAVYAWASAHWRGVTAWDEARWEQEFAAKARKAGVASAPMERLWAEPVQPEAAVAGKAAPAKEKTSFSSIFSRRKVT